MSLNIKDPEAHRLAQTLAKETGESMTRAVTEALREERLQRVQRQRRPRSHRCRAPRYRTPGAPMRSKANPSITGRCSTTSVESRDDGRRAEQSSRCLLQRGRCQNYARAITDADACLISAANFVEVAMVVRGANESDRQPSVRCFTSSARMIIEPVRKSKRT